MMTAQEAYELSMGQGERKKKIDAQIELIEAAIMEACMEGKVANQVELIACRVLPEVNAFVLSKGFKTNYPCENSSWRYYVVWGEA